MFLLFETFIHRQLSWPCTLPLSNSFQIHPYNSFNFRLSMLIVYNSLCVQSAVPIYSRVNGVWLTHPEPHPQKNSPRVHQPSTGLLLGWGLMIPSPPHAKVLNGLILCSIEKRSQLSWGNGCSGPVMPRRHNLSYTNKFSASFAWVIVEHWGDRV
jgi:hypothetical protein